MNWVRKRRRIEYESGDTMVATTMKKMLRHNNTTSEVEAGQGGRCRRVQGFTLIELMLVIGVMVALTAVTLPAFRSLKEGNRESGGINAVSAALNSARTIAVRKGHDVAVMFMFDVKRQVCSMQLIEEAGLTYDADDRSGGWGKATIFIPVKGQAPMELPKGAAVFGYGYGATRLSNADPKNPWNWYAELGQFYEQQKNNPELKGRDPWLFPRTDVRMTARDGKLSEAKPVDVELLDSFIVRFSPEGTVVSSAEELSVGSTSEANDGYLELNALHSDNDRQWKEKSHKWSPQVLNIGNGKYEVIAEVHVRSVPFLAVVDLYKLGAEIGVRSPWLTVGEKHAREGDHAVWNANGNGDPDHVETDKWIRENATILTFNRYTGNVMKEFRR